MCFTQKDTRNSKRKKTVLKIGHFEREVQASNMVEGHWDQDKGYKLGSSLASVPWTATSTCTPQSLQLYRCLSRGRICFSNSQFILISCLVFVNENDIETDTGAIRRYYFLNSTNFLWVWGFLLWESEDLVQGLAPFLIPKTAFYTHCLKVRKWAWTRE